MPPLSLPRQAERPSQLSYGTEALDRLIFGIRKWILAEIPIRLTFLSIGQLDLASLNLRLKSLFSLRHPFLESQHDV